MLYDENVGSHVAWGNAYPTAFRGGLQRNPQQRIDAGLNQSPTHVDVVVGSSEIEIDGIPTDGTSVAIVRGDAFVLSQA